MSLVYEHVVFDLDGTLIDSRVDIANAVNHALQSLALPVLPIDVIAGYIGEGVRVVLQHALGAPHTHQLDAALARFMEFYQDHLLDHTHLFPGIAEVLTELAQRDVLMSVLSNKPEAMSRAILDGLGIVRCFRAVVGGDTIARKPDPTGFEWVRSTTGMPRARMLMVGDSPIDMATARAAGVGFCGVTWGWAREQLMAALPERVINHPREPAQVVASD